MLPDETRDLLHYVHQKTNRTLEQLETMQKRMREIRQRMDNMRVRLAEPWNSAAVNRDSMAPSRGHEAMEDGRSGLLAVGLRRTKDAA